MRALRRHMSGDVDNFPRDVAELVDWFDARESEPARAPGSRLRGAHSVVWLLGSSLYSAQLAAQLGLPFAFASRTSRRIYCSRPCICIAAISNLRRGWKNRTRWCVSISSPPTATAMRSFSSPPCSRRLCLRRGETGRLPPPVENMHQLWSASERYGVQQALSMSLVGDKTKSPPWARVDSA